MSVCADVMTDDGMYAVVKRSLTYVNVVSEEELQMN